MGKKFPEPWGNKVGQTLMDEFNFLALPCGLLSPSPEPALFFSLTIASLSVSFKFILLSRCWNSFSILISFFFLFHGIHTVLGKSIERNIDVQYLMFLLKHGVFWAFESNGIPNVIYAISVEDANPIFISPVAAMP